MPSPDTGWRWCWARAFSARRQAHGKSALRRIIWSSSSVRVPTPRATPYQSVCLRTRHSPTYASPPQSLLHPQNAINVQPSFILIHSPLAQMKWIRNLVGQGRARRPPSVAELFSILPASAEGRARRRREKEAQWWGEIVWHANYRLPCPMRRPGGDCRRRNTGQS